MLANKLLPIFIRIAWCASEGRRRIRECPAYRGVCSTKGETPNGFEHPIAPSFARSVGKLGALVGVVRRNGSAYMHIRTHSHTHTHTYTHTHTRACKCVWMHLVQRMQLRVVSSSQTEWSASCISRFERVKVTRGDENNNHFSWNFLRNLRFARNVLSGKSWIFFRRAERKYLVYVNPEVMIII